MAERQYVAVKFNEWDRRTYTYHNDADLIAVGDRIEVPTPKGNQIVVVDHLPEDKPIFATKAIVRAVPKEDEKVDAA